MSERQKTGRNPAEESAEIDITPTTGGKLGPISEYALRSARSHYVTEMPRHQSEREMGRQEGWDLALRWLRERASSHAGRWMLMDPREAIKATVEDMEKISVNG